ncbi:hypothetical protein Amet_2106 [Alkaliphilus metalliredigens QYMF]|uniref:DUF5673 domain-containing protein n=1 Tax=Alkaliphilus metalliredigens (strain QYMF) TaxID=293826 RepID=A6TPZ8_ALKMQ|nr:DUF5673 domain-containing protein [Alkaliphilus metalliredigens]ABR48266.1 hypothetical protein Amet_2106 [Alkaliphilus metalliredigens QYMF]
MGEIKFFDIILLLAAISVIYQFIKDLNRKKYVGKLIFKASQDFDSKATIFFWSMLGCIWLFFLIARGVNIERYDYMHPIRMIMPRAVWVLISLQYIYKYHNNKEIRERGITTDTGFIYWKEIVCYDWKESNKLEITYRPSGRFSLKKERNKIWTIENEDKKEISKLFDDLIG